MACFCNGNCAFSGGQRRRNRRSALRGGGSAATGQPCSNLTTAQQLYAPECTEERSETCCDTQHGCGTFPTSARCPFWPSFAHPRWLSCAELYNRRR